MASAAAANEIRALASRLDELDYYALMRLQRGASATEVKRAYFASSREYHPDANRALPEELRAAVERISKRVTEAYSVLRDPRRRAAYDRRLADGRGVRIQLAEASAEAGRSETQQKGRTPQGRQFFARAESDRQRGDLASALRNLQTALTFEPDNALFKEQIAELRRRLR